MVVLRGEGCKVKGWACGYGRCGVGGASRDNEWLVVRVRGEDVRKVMRVW